MAEDGKNPIRAIVAHWPLIAALVSVVVTGTAAQFQINANAANIAENKRAIEGRVPTFLYDRDRKTMREDFVELAGNVDGNEDLLDQLERSTDQIDSRIELEVERLRNLIREADREQAAKLETILQLLERRLAE